MTRLAFSCSALGLALTLFAPTAHAQTAPAASPTPTSAADPAAATAPAEPALTAAPADEAAACFPACRAGYLCSAGQCISACNPLCGPGERCTADGQCELPSALPAASAPPAPPAPAAAPTPTGHADDGDDDYTHDGFMLRVTLGFAGGAMNEDYDGALSGTGVGNGTAEYSGGGVAFSVDIGGALSDNFTLHGRLGLISFAEPNRNIDGADYGSYDDRQLTSFILGPGLTYTFMPVNIYVTGVVGVGGTAFSESHHDDEDDADDGDDFDEVGDNKPGLAFNLDVGKEWWLTPRAGAGVAVRFWFASSKFEDAFYESERRTLALALLFSLTYQ